MKHRYSCTYGSVKYGKRKCTDFSGDELDEAVVTQVLRVLGSPPVESLNEALSEARKSEKSRELNLEAERLRLEQREGLLRDRFEACSPKNNALFNDLQDQLNDVLVEKQRSAQRLLAERLPTEIKTTEKEIEDLCELAREVPKIWSHSLVTDHERKEIIGCLIEIVVVIVTAETTEAIICWISGAKTPLKLYRKAGKQNLVKELHALGCNSREILDRLKRGETSTGQSMKLHVESLYKIYKRLGLKPHLKPSWYKPLQQEAVRLREQGQTCRNIADLFN